MNINTENTNVILGDRFERISGDERLYDSLLGKSFALSPASFYQVNPEMTEKLYSVAKEFAELKDNEVCLDLYCGAGTVGLCLVNETNKLCGVEIIEDAIENAKLNAEMNGRSQGETLFLAGDARIGIEACKKAFGKPDVIVVDPPRKGLEAKLIEEICDACPDRVVYISCNPSTLARDVALFAEKGFYLKKIQAVDLFPRTTHVETVILLSRKDIHERIKFDVNVEELNRISQSK
ncbi:MAG: 23S rRNA (uracil(1939)-C(5))-methyltransferase RlmD [Clostridia bacterium]|nr:23S rRNA (uracil(1939)-C(5))-methyltransferase RlmD [Clostridia bacterium]